jgi:dolichol-phosphate mannosyltransferase
MTEGADIDLDIVIPVYNEGQNIIQVIDALLRELRCRFRVLICYDFEEDNTLTTLAANPREGLSLVLVRNPERGPHAAVRAGLAASKARAVLVYMADDDFNADVAQAMYQRHLDGFDVVAASRFVPGGCMEGCHWLKELITRVGSLSLCHLGGLPVHDGTNAFRLFSRRLLDSVEIESKKGFTFSIELTAKAARLGLPIAEVPARWYERLDKPSRFRILAWLPAYIQWLGYAMATVWLRRGADSVMLRQPLR